MADTQEPDLIGDYDQTALAPRWEGTLADVRDCITAAFSRAPSVLTEPRQLAEVATLALAEYLGGRAVYLPRGHVLKTALRDQRLFADYTGDNIHELTRKYRLCEQAVYGIIRRQRKRQARSSS